MSDDMNGMFEDFIDEEIREEEKTLRKRKAKIKKLRQSVTTALLILSDAKCHLTPFVNREEGVEWRTGESPKVHRQRIRQKAKTNAAHFLAKLMVR